MVKATAAVAMAEAREAVAMVKVKLAAETRGNRLRGSEYDATTWAARTWLSYVTHRLACAG